MSKEAVKPARRFDLEERLIAFAVRIIQLAAALPRTPAGRHIAGQLARSGTSPASHCGEAESAESRTDFIHKMKVCLKELRETRVWLLMIQRASMIKPASRLDSLVQESDQVISIFVSSISTAQRNRRSKGEGTDVRVQT